MASGAAIEDERGGIALWSVQSRDGMDLDIRKIDCLGVVVPVNRRCRGPVIQKVCFMIHKVIDIQGCPSVVTKVAALDGRCGSDLGSRRGRGGGKDI